MRERRVKRYILIVVLFSFLFLSCQKGGDAEWQAKYDAGMRMMEKADYEEAIRAFQAAVQLNVAKAEGYASLAEAFLGAGRLNDAEEILRFGIVRCGEHKVFKQVQEQIAEKKGSSVSNTTSAAALQGTTVSSAQWIAPTKHTGNGTADGESRSEAVLNNTLFKEQTFFNRERITQISFLDSLEKAPENAWDFSKAGDRRVLAWLDGTHLYVAGDGSIYLDTDATNLFMDFSALKTIDLGAVDTSLVTNMRWMFKGCAALQELDVSGFDTSNVTNMGGMFMSCRQLTEIDVNGFDTSNVMTMGAMFYECWNLPELDVSGFDTSNVTSMSDMFHDCKSLTNLDLSGFQTEKVTTMRFMFTRCFKLAQLNISGFDTSNVTDMAYMFSECSLIETLDLSHFQTGKVKEMQEMFTLSFRLKTVDVSSFDTSSVTNMSGMFRYCYALEEPDISHFDTSKIEDEFLDLRRYLCLTVK